MTSFVDFRMKEVLDSITLGVLKSLEHHPGVMDVRMMDQKPAEQDIIDLWEKKFMCKIPSELQSFYQTTDGLLIQWNVNFHGNLLQLGRMEINPIASLTKLTYSKSYATSEEPSLFDIDSETDELDAQGNIKPHFDERNRIYELDNCGGFGKVCLVYKDIKAGFTTCKPEIWFLDRALQWYFLADNFIKYFRMMMIHLGLPCWQYLFTDSGLSPETKCWFNLYAPMRLKERANEIGLADTNETNVQINKIDIQRIFKAKSDKKKVTNDSSKNRATGSSTKQKLSSYKQQKNLPRSPQR